MTVPAGGTETLAAVFRPVNTVLLLLVLLALLAVMGMLATGVRGGPLDPPGPPSSSMKTLDSAAGPWDRRLDATNGVAGPDPPAGCNSTRFRCVLTYVNDNVTVYPAVLDVETGLVWERTPSSLTGQWLGLMDQCWQSATGQRRGWRMPRIEEFDSLLDPQNGYLPPVGSPFTGVAANDVFWSSSESRVDFLGEFVTIGSSTHGRGLRSTILRTWCVRGGSGESIERASQATP
jgi:hypothetical protein